MRGSSEGTDRELTRLHVNDPVKLHFSRFLNFDSHLKYGIIDMGRLRTSITLGMEVSLESNQHCVLEFSAHVFHFHGTESHHHL